jgi:hypothetical protein
MNDWTLCNVAVDTTPPRAAAPPVVNVAIGQPFTIPQLSTVGDFSDTTVTVTLGTQRVAQVCVAPCSLTILINPAWRLPA